jgi:hypothetical protein
MPTFTGKNTDNTSLKERIEIIEFPYSFVDDEYMIETNPDKYKKRNKEVKSPVYGYAFFLLLLTFVSLKLGSDVVYSFKVKLAKLRFFDAVGDELADWFRIGTGQRGRGIAYHQLKIILNQFKLFASSKMSIPAFIAAIIRICGKRVDGGAGYYVNRSDHMLQGYKKMMLK